MLALWARHYLVPERAQKWEKHERLPRTSLLVTGFPISDKYVRDLKPAKGSKSASSAILFLVRTRVRRFGMLDERLG